jgi:hypothetical protein
MPKVHWAANRIDSVYNSVSSSLKKDVGLCRTDQLYSRLADVLSRGLAVSAAGIIIGQKVVGQLEDFAVQLRNS